MRIAHVVGSGEKVLGGRETHIQRFAQECLRMGHETLLVSDAEVRSGGAAALMGFGTDAGGVPVGPDVVLLHSRDSWQLTGEIEGVAPLFAWVHDQSFVCPASISWSRTTHRACDRALGAACVSGAYTRRCNARRPDRNLHNYLQVRRTLSGVPSLTGVIVASGYMARRLAAGGVPEHLLHVLPYFVPLPEAAPPAEESPERILYVGRLNETKGVDVLISALALLPSRYTLHIAGDGYAAGTLREHVRGCGIAPERVTFGGYVTDAAVMDAAYREAAVLAFPSLWPEPFGIVGIEAMSHGKPVVAFDVGGVSDWLDDGRVGLLARPGDAADLAAKLLALMEDPARRRELGERGRARVADLYSWPAHWDGFAGIVAGVGV
ncbi:MAG TPA: glycosyltransferase family 4 protein [Longimicrobiaceae bacterium]|jgi:glycosyltransferase involved in cell wall biosynthesis|nr:glycosyltransferase family 4 protein [Longimicrobiaceae bacterium]